MRGCAWLLLWLALLRTAEALRTGQVPAGASGRALASSGRDAARGVDGRAQGGRDAATSAEAAAESVDAWLHMSHVQQTLEQNMYTPMLVSVQDALEKVGATTRIVDWHSDLEMLEGVRKAVAKSKRPLVVNVAIKFGTKKAMRALEACSKAGAYLVLYSTEAADAEWMSGAAANLSAQEVWEYALSNIDRYGEDFRRRIPVRYMPPGYSPRLEAGVDLKSPSRQVDSAGFLGGFGYRPGAIKMLYRTTLGSRLTLPGEVWTQEQQRKYLSEFPLQLNVHKEQSCCPHDPNEPVAMEAFRMAVLLANKACVLSTPIPEKDRRLWEGIVHFAEPDQTLQALNLLRADVLGCQERAASLFRQRFDPLKLMRDSGFLEAWRPSGLTGPAAASGRPPPRSRRRSGARGSR